MPTHFEESLQRDIDRIKAKVMEMAALDERALRDCIRALRERNRQIAYTVILRDRRIDEMEKENDRLCLEFLVRQQPVGSPLRFAYATIRINLELERVGDYAESIARQVLKLIAMNVEMPVDRFAEIANLAIPMLNDAVRAFVTQDAALAESTMEIEEKVDVLRNRINAELFKSNLPPEALTPLMTIARRFERVSDQAKNVCQEVLYMCTGKYSKHQADGAFRLLFVDKHNSCRSVMAESIGHSLKEPRLVFASAGLDPRAMRPAALAFLKDKGVDLARHVPRTLDDVPNLEDYDVIIGLADEVQKALPPSVRKTMYLNWSVEIPPEAEKGSPEESYAAYEKTYQTIRASLHDLVKAVLGEANDGKSQ